MGGANTKNISQATTEAVAKVASNILMSQNVLNNQTQMIKIIGGKGDVNIHGVNFNQKAAVNISALLDAMVTQEAQQQLATELAQKAKSVVSGVNLFQFTNASNEIDTFMKASIDISTNIAQTCSLVSSQSQGIDIEYQEGNINISNINMDQVSDLFSSCVGKAVSQNKALQDLQQKLDQSAVAESKGFSIWAIVVMMFIALLFFMAPLVFAASTAVKVLSQFMFPIIMTIGIIMVALYFSVKKPQMSGYGFSRLLRTMPDCGVVKSNIQPRQVYDTAGRASEACLADSTCHAVDWKCMDIQADGTAVILQNPETTFYSKIDHNPCKNIVDNRDNLKILRVPNVVVLKDDPDPLVYKPQDGDIWVDANTSKWSVWNDQNTQYMSDNLKNNPLVEGFDGKKNSIIFEQTNGSPLNDPKQEGDIVLKFATTKLPFFDIYTAVKFDNNLLWNEPVSLSVPGYFPYIPRAPNNANAINSTAFKKVVKKYNSTVLWIGLSLILLGMFGTVYVFMIKPKSSK